MATFNLKSGGRGEWTEKRLRNARSVEPRLNPQQVTHAMFCKQRADFWLGQLTTSQEKTHEED